ncbi:MAG: ABC transporter substrate-binding protein [Sphingobium sp.]
MVRLNRRQALVGAAALAGLSACGRGRADGGTRITIWRHKAAASYFMEAAGQADFPYGVDYADLPGGNAVLNAYAADAIDYAFMSQIPPVFALQAGIPLALIGSYQGDVNNSGLLVRPGSKVRTIDDLRGKSVTYVPTTNDHYYLLKILDAHGMMMRDIVPVALPVTDANAAFTRGHVEARCAGGITALLTETQLGGRWIHRTMRGLYSGNFVISAHPRSLADPDKRAAILDYRRREQATWDWIADHVDQWAEISGKLSSLPASLYRRLAREHSRPGKLVLPGEDVIADQQDVADFMAEHGMVDRKLDIRPLWYRNG